MEREYDIIVWGASGFTGRLVVDYMQNSSPTVTSSGRLPGETHKSCNRYSPAVIFLCLPQIAVTKNQSALWCNRLGSF